MAPDPTLEERVQALGTVLAVLVALFIGLLPTWRQWRRRPKLRLVFDGDGDDLALGIGVADPGGRATIAHWYRARVQNGGRTSADDVEVLLVGCAVLVWGRAPASATKRFQPDGSPAGHSRGPISLTPAGKP